MNIEVVLIVARADTRVRMREKKHVECHAAISHTRKLFQAFPWLVRDVFGVRMISFQ